MDATETLLGMTSRDFRLQRAFWTLATAGLLVAAGSSAADAPWIQRVGEPVQLDVGDSDINAVTASSDGKQLFVDTDAALLVLDRSTFKRIGAAVTGHRPTSGLGVPLSRGTLLIVTTFVPPTGGGAKAAKAGGELLLVDWVAKTSKHLAALSNETMLLAVSGNGARAAVVYADSTVQVFDATSGKSLLGPLKLTPATVVMGEHIDKVTALALSPDGTRLALGSEDVSVRLLDAATGLHPLVLDQGAFHGVSFVHASAKQLAFTADGLRLLCFEQGGNFALYEVASGKPLGALVQVRSKVQALATSTDGKRVITGLPDGQLQDWALQAQ
jgi:WD40 repeat protein